jgi:hypothetical protein
MRKLVLVMLMLLLGSALTVTAQDAPPVMCGSLAEADCAVLTDSAAAMMELESAAFTFQLDLNLSNIPNMGPGELNFRLTGDGAYHIVPGSLNMAIFSPEQMAENMDQLPEIFDSVIKAISADMNMVFFLPESLVKATEGTPSALPERVGLTARLVDGFGYVNLDKLAELDPSGQIPSGWLGMDIATFYRRTLEQSMDMMQGSDLTGLMSSFSQPDFMEDYLMIERLADVQVDGQDAAVFQTQFDLSAFYGSDAFRDYMRETFEASMSGMGGSSSEAEIDQMLDMLGSIYDGMTMQTTQTIGLSDGYVHAADLTLDWPLDFNALAGSMGGAGSAGLPSEPLNINIVFSGTLTSFNDAPTISAPEDAQIAPLDSLMPGF